MKPTEVPTDLAMPAGPEDAAQELAAVIASDAAAQNADGAAVAPDWTELKALVEAVIYVTDEPLSADQIATALARPAADVGRVLEQLTAEYNAPGRGLSIREIAGGYKLSTKPEHHEAIRAFVKNLKPPLKLSLPALETLALIAYKQPITAPEVMDVRGVQGAGVIKTLLDRKLIATAGRKNVVGKPILYKTTKDFLVQFGLKDLSELPTLKEFEELARLSSTDDTPADPVPAAERADAEGVGAEESDAASEPPENGSE
jgi:segregation and condensation protein B